MGRGETVTVGWGIVFGGVGSGWVGVVGGGKVKLDSSGGVGGEGGVGVFMVTVIVGREAQSARVGRLPDRNRRSRQKRVFALTSVVYEEVAVWMERIELAF